MRGRLLRFLEVRSSGEKCTMEVRCFSVLFRTTSPRLVPLLQGFVSLFFETGHQKPFASDVLSRVLSGKRLGQRVAWACQDQNQIVKGQSDVPMYKFVFVQVYGLDTGNMIGAKARLEGHFTYGFVHEMLSEKHLTRYSKSSKVRAGFAMYSILD